MKLTEKEIKRQLRKHLKRKLKLVGGHGQVTVRRLVKSIYPKRGKSCSYVEEPSLKNRRQLYSIADMLCKEAGGKIMTLGYCRYNRLGCVSSRVYQF